MNITKTNSTVRLLKISHSRQSRELCSEIKNAGNQNETLFEGARGWIKKF